MAQQRRGRPVFLPRVIRRAPSGDLGGREGLPLPRFRIRRNISPQFIGGLSQSAEDLLDAAAIEVPAGPLKIASALLPELAPPAVASFGKEPVLEIIQGRGYGACRPRESRRNDFNAVIGDIANQSRVFFLNIPERDRVLIVKSHQQTPEKFDR